MDNDLIRICRIVKPALESTPAKEVFETSLPSVIWHKIAKIGLYILIFLAPIFFLPLTIAPVEINKQFLALVLVLVVLCCYLILSINSRRIFYPRSWLSLAILIFLATVGVSAIFSVSPLTSVFGNFIQPDAFLPFLIYGLTFFLASVFIKKEDLIKVALFFLASLTLTAVLGLLQIFGKFIFPWDFTRQISFNPIGSVFGWGIFITFGLVMLIAALISLKLSRFWQMGLSLVGLLIMATLAILNFQMLWAGLALAMFLLATSRFAAKAEITLPLIIITASLFFILVGRQLPVLVNIPIETRPNLAATVTVTRGVVGDIKPILLGSGPATFGYNYSQFRPIELNLTNFWPLRFNQGVGFVPTILSTLGILGLLAFLFVIYSFIRQGLKVWRDEGALILVSGISFLLINLFFYPAFFNQLLFIFLGLGLFAGDSEQNFNMEFYSGNKWRNIRGFSVFLGVILLIGFSLVAFYTSSQRYAAAVYYAKGLHGLPLTQSAAWIEKAARLDSQSDEYWWALSQIRLLQANELSRTALAENAPEIQNQLQNIIAETISVARRAVELNPANSLNWANLGHVYENIMPIEGADVFAKEHYNKVIELEPNNPQSWVNLARVLITSADQGRLNGEGEGAWREKLNEARVVLDKSVALKSDYIPAHFLIAQIYIRENNLAKAIERLEKVEQLDPNNQEIKNILTNLKEGGEALGDIVPLAQSPEEGTQAPAEERP